MIEAMTVLNILLWEGGLVQVAKLVTPVPVSDVIMMGVEVTMPENLWNR